MSRIVGAEEARRLLEGTAILAPFRVGPGLGGSQSPAVLGGERQQHIMAWGVYAGVAHLLAAAPDLAATVIALAAERDAYRDFARRIAALMAPPDAADMAVKYMEFHGLDDLAETVAETLEQRARDGRRSGMEEAAQLCDARGVPSRDPRMTGIEEGARYCAEDIRDNAKEPA